MGADKVVILCLQYWYDVSIRFVPYSSAQQYICHGMPARWHPSHLCLYVYRMTSGHLLVVIYVLCFAVSRAAPVPSKLASQSYKSVHCITRCHSWAVIYVSWRWTVPVPSNLASQSCNSIHCITRWYLCARLLAEAPARLYCAGRGLGGYIRPRSAEYRWGMWGEWMKGREGERKGECVIFLVETTVGRRPCV